MDQPHRRVRRALGARLTGLVAALGLFVAVLALPSASAAFRATTANTGDAWGADEVLPPSNLTASQVCTGSPVVLRGVSTGTGTTSVNLSTPSGTVAGDVLVVHAAHRDTTASVTPPTGWAAFGTDVIGDQMRSTMFWRVATNPEPTSATFNRLNGSGQMTVGMAAYSGIDTTQPVDAHGGKAGTGSLASTQSVTTTTANTVLLHFVAQRGDVISAPSQTTALWSILSGSGAPSMGAAAGWESFAATGATPSRSFTVTNSWVTQTVALRTNRQAGASLTWTASPSSWADGYRLERSAGGTVQGTRSLTIATTATTESPLVNGVTYTFRLWTYRGAWVSTAVSTTLTPSC